jgi:hypothetical protein
MSCSASQIKPWCLGIFWQRTAIVSQRMRESLFSRVLQRGVKKSTKFQVKRFAGVESNATIYRGREVPASHSSGTSHTDQIGEIFVRSD